MSQTIETAAKLKHGYASLLGAPAAAFDQPGFRLEVLEARSQVAWGDWLQPIWAVSLFSTTLCTVAPMYAAQTASIFGALAAPSLLSPNLLDTLQGCFGPAGWQPLEILVYPSVSILLEPTTRAVTRLDPLHPEYKKYSTEFSGGTYAVLNGEGRILAWAGIKDHGSINEIAVGTDPQHRRQGLGKAVLSWAVAEILARGRVPVYVPDALDNAASYALARSLGFEKIGEMLLWEVQNS
jgi:GNAT superfamily N-acetyltransferase